MSFFVSAVTKFPLFYLFLHEYFVRILAFEKKKPKPEQFLHYLSVCVCGIYLTHILSSYSHSHVTYD